MSFRAVTSPGRESAARQSFDGSTFGFAKPRSSRADSLRPLTASLRMHKSGDSTYMNMSERREPSPKDGRPRPTTAFELSRTLTTGPHADTSFSRSLELLYLRPRLTRPKETPQPQSAQQPQQQQPQPQQRPSSAADSAAVRRSKDERHTAEGSLQSKSANARKRIPSMSHMLDLPEPEITPMRGCLVRLPSARPASAYVRHARSHLDLNFGNVMMAGHQVQGSGITAALPVAETGAEKRCVRLSRRSPFTLILLTLSMTSNLSYHFFCIVAIAAAYVVGGMAHWCQETYQNTTVDGHDIKEK